MKIINYSIGSFMVMVVCLLIGVAIGLSLPRNKNDNANCGAELEACNSTLEEYRNYKLSIEAYVGALETQSKLLSECMSLIR
jgi:uncharacterized membrane-anchored protein YhcB (DUF1043 family)